LGSTIGTVGAVATVANDHHCLQITAAVVAGVIVGTGSLLAFT